MDVLPASEPHQPKFKLRKLFNKFGLKSIRLGPRWASIELSFEDADKDAAWELYIEMLTRIVTQPLPSESGDEKTALDSVYSLFATTREILRRHGKDTVHFSTIAIPILNQVVRPFTAKWHRKSLSGAFKKPRGRKEFRDDLADLQQSLLNYNKMLAEIAGVEDLTDLENP